MLTYDLNENNIGFYSKRVVKFETLLNLKACYFDSCGDDYSVAFTNIKLFKS